jgi:hypothetical protein
MLPDLVPHKTNQDSTIIRDCTVLKLVTHFLTKNLESLPFSIATRQHLTF